MNNQSQTDLEYLDSCRASKTFSVFLYEAKARADLRITRFVVDLLF